MKKNLAISCSMLLFALLFIPGCQKETRDAPGMESDVELESRSRHGDENGCRLISRTSEYGDEFITYNKKGLVDEWHISNWGGYFKHEYDRKGRLVQSKLYVENEVANTIKLTYRHDKVVTETWYLGETDEKTDELFFHYNWKGQLVRSESFIGDFAAAFEYTKDGNLLKGVIMLGGKLYYTVEFTYLRRNKNPFSAIRGVGHDYTTWLVPFTRQKWYSTSEKDVIYEEPGIPTVLVDQDPYKTIVETNRSGYVTRSDFYDKLTQEYVHFRFEFENCGRGHHYGNHNSHTDHARPSLNTTVPNYTKGVLSPHQLFKKGSTKSIKERISEYRKQLEGKIKLQ